jgi:hypothetical protein
MDSEKKAFAATGKISLWRERSHPMRAVPTGDLWVYPSQDLWERFDNLPRLGSLVKGSWGLRWKSGQSERTSDLPGPDRELGYQDSASLHQFVLGSARWMDVRPESILAGGNLAWDEPKILCNATRLSRGYWRLAAAVDRNGRRATQQFMGLWPRDGAKLDLDALAAVINGPVVNAFLSEHSFDKRFRIAKLEEAPIPSELPTELGELSREYLATARQDATSPELAAQLAAIDGLVLDAYGMSKADRAALYSLMGEDRPVVGMTSRRRLTKNNRKQQSQNSNLFATTPTERDDGQGFGDIVSEVIGLNRLAAVSMVLPVTDWAGHVADAEHLASEFAFSKGEIERLTAEGALISINVPDQGLVYPLEQFFQNRPTPGIADVLEIVGDPKVAWLWLRTPRPATGELAPIFLLRSGDRESVLVRAERDFA